jgi:hypothetical protein
MLSALRPSLARSGRARLLARGVPLVLSVLACLLFALEGCGPEDGGTAPTVEASPDGSPLDPVVDGGAPDVTLDLDASADVADADADAAAAVLPLGESTATAGGGTFAFGGAVTLDMPAGAVGADTPIVIGQINELNAAGALSPYFAFQPHGLQFAKPVTVRIAVPAGTKAARILWSSDTGAGYDTLPTRIEGAFAVTETTHFSIAVVAPGLDPDGGAADGGAAPSKCGNGTIDALPGQAGPYCSNYQCARFRTVFGRTYCIAYKCVAYASYPIYEQCDDGNAATETCTYGVASCVVCRQDCTVGAGLPGASCGDGVVNGANGETCDDGNVTTEACPYGQATCTVCTAGCTTGPGVVTGVCGDGTKNGPEQCDDGNVVTEACAYGQANCTICRADCSTGPGVVTGICGDGLTNGPEACDDGNAATEACPYGVTGCTVCRSDCTPGPGVGTGFCGDALTNGPEACDDGNAVTEGCAYGQVGCTVCRADCTVGGGTTAYCGDGKVDVAIAPNPDEQCDDGNSVTEACPPGVSCTVCRANCTTGPGTGTYCGNGVVEDNEQCDTFPEGDCTNYGFVSGNVTCSASCTINTSQCTRYASEIIAAGTSTSYNAQYGASSHSGRIIAWTTSQSGSTNVTSDPPGTGTRIYYHQRDVAPVGLLVAPDNMGTAVLPNGAVTSLSLDDLGDLLAFSTTATNVIVPDANAAVADCVLWHAGTHVFERVPSRTGAQPTGGCTTPALSRSGRYLALSGDRADFAADATGGQYYLYDRSLGLFEAIDVGVGGVAPSDLTAVGRLAISADARYVVFVSAASNLVANDTNGRADVFVRDRQLGTTTRVSVTNAGGQLANGATDFVVSADGRRVAFFANYQDMTGTPGGQHVFVRNLTTQTTVHASPYLPGQAGWQPGLTRLYSVDGRGRPLFGDSTKTYLFEGGSSVLLIPPGPSTTIYIGAYFTKDEQNTVAWTTAYSASGGRFVALTARGPNGM